jgi:hypothetical protein
MNDAAACLITGVQYKFLHEHMPNAEKVFAMGLSKFRHFYVGKPGTSLFEILNTGDLEFQ